MAWLKFVDDLVPYKGGVTRISDHVIKVNTSQVTIPPNASGFRAYLDEQLTRLLGDWRTYHYLYSYTPGMNYFYLSDNGVMPNTNEVEIEKELVE